MRLRRGIPLLAAALMALTAVGPAQAEGGDPPAGHCAHRDRVLVPGAEFQQAACLPDLTTHGLAGTQYTDESEQILLSAAGTANPSGVPGIQVDGYFPDSSRLNTTHGWNHDSQFVLRLPDHWNGGLIITGGTAFFRQYSLDKVISDWVLAQGYAYASTDKGNNTADFYTDGNRPGDAIAEWNARTTQLTLATKTAVALHYGQLPRHTYITGMSNSGYLTRWQLENHPELYDGGVDWEGALWTADKGNLLETLPTGVAYSLGRASEADMLAAGFPDGSQFLWPFFSGGFWSIPQKTARAELDPSYDPACPGASAGSTPSEIATPCASDAQYRYADRPASVRRAIQRIQLTGRIGKPLITLHGSLDVLSPISTDSDVYQRMIQAQGRDRLHRYYTIEGGTHIDGLHDYFPDKIRPILPCYRAAFSAMTDWVEHRVAPPADHTVPRPASGDVVNSCSVS